MNELSGEEVPRSVGPGIVGGPKGLGRFRKSLEAERSEDGLVAQDTLPHCHALVLRTRARMYPATRRSKLVQTTGHQEGTNAGAPAPK